eukprot:4748407-Alexandrium_andersonii.AAC.1
MNSESECCSTGRATTWGMDWHCCVQAMTWQYTNRGRLPQAATRPNSMTHDGLDCRPHAAGQSKKH